MPLFTVDERVFDWHLREMATVVWASEVDYREYPGQAMVVVYDSEPERDYSADGHYFLHEDEVRAIIAEHMRRREEETNNEYNDSALDSAGAGGTQGTVEAGTSGD